MDDPLKVYVATCKVVCMTGISEKPHPADEPPEVYAVHIDHSPSNSGLVVTGGRDDTAYVWFMNSGQVLFECTGMFHILGEYAGVLHMLGKCTGMLHVLSLIHI